MSEMKEFIKSINDRTTVFPDIDGWKVIRSGRMHLIYNKRSHNVAFLSSKGVLNVIPGKNGNSYETEWKFNPDTQLDQAVRCCYLMAQGKSDIRR